MKSAESIAIETTTTSNKHLRHNDSNASQNAMGASRMTISESRKQYGRIWMKAAIKAVIIDANLQGT